MVMPPSTKEGSMEHEAMSTGTPTGRLTAPPFLGTPTCIINQSFHSALLLLLSFLLFSPSYFSLPSSLYLPAEPQVQDDASFSTHSGWSARDWPFHSSATSGIRAAEGSKLEGREGREGEGRAGRAGRAGREGVDEEGREEIRSLKTVPACWTEG